MCSIVIHSNSHLSENHLGKLVGFVVRKEVSYALLVVPNVTIHSRDACSFSVRSYHRQKLTRTMDGL